MVVSLAGITYTLSFDVKTTDAAYDKYVESGYDKIAGGDGNQTEITGDADTDYLGTNPANTTSSGKPGFRSNDSAKASYKHNGTDTGHFRESKQTGLPGSDFPDSRSFLLS